MLIPLPDILMDRADRVDIEKGEWVLKEPATEEQRKAFEKFLKALKEAKARRFVIED